MVKVHLLVRIRTWGPCSAAEDVTKRPRRLSRKDGVKNFYLNKTDVIIAVNTSKVI